MIKLMGVGGEPLYLAPEHIAAVYPREEEWKSTVVMVGEESGYPVHHPAEEVVKRIAKYKLLQMQLNAHYIAISQKMSFLEAKEVAIYYEKDILGEAQHD